MVKPFSRLFHIDFGFFRLFALFVFSLSSYNGTVASGKKLKGCLFYELSNEWNELEIDISIGLSKEDEVKFLFTK